MPDNKEPPVSQEQEIQSVRSEKFFKVYANSAQIEANPYDFRLIFGEVTKFGSNTTIEQYVAVIMSPQHAKALLGILAGHLREYEKQIGEIKLPSAPQGMTEAEPPSAKK